MKILIASPKGVTRDTFFTPKALELAKSFSEVVINENERRLTKEELCRLIEDCDVYVAGWGDPCIDVEVLRSARRLKLIAVLGSTVKPFVCPEVWERGIRVISGAEFFSVSTAEGTIAYILAALRDIPYFNSRLVKDRVWPGADKYDEGLLYKKVGLIGYGGVGRHVARMLSVFSTEVYVYDIREIPEEERRKVGFRQCGIEEIFSECDVISLHMPHNEHTDKMINDRLMSMIKKNALLVNTARGGVIDQAALTKHLAEGHFRAALDVFDREPIDMADPLLDLPDRRALLMPHMGGVTIDLRERVAISLLHDIESYIVKGIPPVNEIPARTAAQMSFK